MKKTIPISSNSRVVEEKSYTYAEVLNGYRLFYLLSFINTGVQLWPQHTHFAKDFKI